MGEILIVCGNGIASLDKAMATINQLGGKIFDIFVQGCYWFFAINIVTDIIKKAKDHDYMGCLKMALAGVGGFAAVKLTRFGLDVIKEAF